VTPTADLLLAGGGSILVALSVFLLIQVFHAVQYLAFPLRVEVNEFIDREADGRDRQVRHAVIYYGIPKGAVRSPSANRVVKSAAPA
jgi:hypothetical protein